MPVRIQPAHLPEIPTIVHEVREPVRMKHYVNGVTYYLWNLVSIFALYISSLTIILAVCVLLDAQRAAGAIGLVGLGLLLVQVAFWVALFNDNSYEVDDED